MSEPRDIHEPEAPVQDAVPSPDINAEQPKKRRFSKRTFFFGACAILAIVIYAVANLDSLVGVFRRLGDILAPVIIGGVIAYLCNPFLKFYEHTVFRRMGKSNARRALSLLLTFLTVLAILAAIVALIVPELINSLTALVENADQYLDSILAGVQGIIDKLPFLDIDVSDKEALIDFIEESFGSMEEAVNELLTKLRDLVLTKESLDAVMNFLKQFVNAVKNIFLGIFIAFYILSSKEKRIAQIRKFRAAFLTDKQDQKIKELTALVDKTFGGFIKGLLLDALAVGGVTFILLTLFGVSEYNLLISVICAVTNIIPVFGPFIGAIPSGLIVLITNPSKFIVFVILILVIQQIDGNILVPRIQGSNTGISSLAVLIAITVMGSLFGLMGMIIGVPVFAVIIEMIKRAIEARLQKKNAPTDTTEYYPSDAVGNAEEDVYYEHSHLRYKYEHSKLKIRVDRVRGKMAARRATRKAARKAKKDTKARIKAAKKKTAQEKRRSNKKK